MKILYLITKAELGGAQTHLLDVLRHFRQEHELLLVTGEEGFLTEQARALGVRVQIVPSLVHPIRPMTDLRCVADLRRLIRSERPTLLHLHSTKAGIVGRIAARLEGCPAVFTAHGWAFSHGVPLSRKLIAYPIEWLMGRFRSPIINVSEFDRRLAVSWGVGHASQHSVVHNGVPDGAPAAHMNDGEMVVVMTARFGAQKNQQLLVQALAQLPPAVRVRFVGDGPLMPAVKDLAASLGVSARVEFVGSSREVPAILAQAQVFALISHYEGFPISILEAMRAGLPVVASNVGGVSEAVQDGETGFLVDQTLASVVAALRRLHDEPGLRVRMGSASRQRYLKHFTDEHMVSRIHAVYQQAAGAR